MAGYDFTHSQDRSNIEAFGSDVVDATVLPEGAGFIVRIETAQGDFFAVPHATYAAASATAERLLCA